MDITASMASQAYTAAKPTVAGAQGTGQSGSTSPISQSTQTRQVTFDATSSSPAFVLDISTQILKVEKLSDMSAADQQYWQARRQELADKLEAQGRAFGQEGWSHKLDGEDITFGQEDGTAKVLRADGYVVTTRENLTAEQEGAITRYFAELGSDHAAANTIGAAAGGQSTAPAPASGTAATQDSASAEPAAQPAQAKPFDSSMYSHKPGFSERKLSDLSEEEQQALLKLRDQTKAMLAVFGDTFDGTVGHTSQSGLTTVITADDRVITYQQDTRFKLTPEQIAQRKAADEQRQKEAAGRAAAQAEWDKKWVASAEAWKGPMSSAEYAAAEDVAQTESMLYVLRHGISTTSGLVYQVQQNEAALNHAVSNSGSSDLIDKLTKEIAEARDKILTLANEFSAMQERFRREYGYQVEGNLVEKLADGRYREGRYTLTKTTANWAVKVNSDEGVTVSIGRGPFTRNFKRVVVYEPGPSSIQLETREESAQRVKATR